MWSRNVQKAFKCHANMLNDSTKLPPLCWGSAVEVVFWYFIRFLNVRGMISQTRQRETTGRTSDAGYKSYAAPPQCYCGISFLFCSFALFLLHPISLRYSLQVPPPPSKDLFMETESLNPCSLYSSEAVR